MQESDDDEFPSPSDPSDSSDEFVCDRDEGRRYVSESDSESEYDNENGNDSDHDEDGDDEPSIAHRLPEKDDRKSQNVAALVTGNLLVKRQSLLPRVLSVSDRAAVVRKPFKPPCSNGYHDQNEQLIRRLWARKRFVPWGSTRPALVAITNRLSIPSAPEKELPEEIISLPPGIEPLVLWQPEECDEGAGNLVSISVDPLLVCFLRPHQRYLKVPEFFDVRGSCLPYEGS
ncbi:DNA-dependent ATPase protein rad54 [Sarracenia purpurea var. burkii]